MTPEEEDRLLQVSLRTRRRWKQRTRLDPATSDRLVRLARILALATDVLERQENWYRIRLQDRAGEDRLSELSAPASSNVFPLT